MKLTQRIGIAKFKIKRRGKLQHDKKDIDRRKRTREK